MMTSINNLVARLVREEEGAAASEYAILVAVIAALIAVAIAQFDLGGIFAAAAGKVVALVNAA